MTNKKNKSIRIFAWFGVIFIAIVFAVMPFIFNNKKSSVYAIESDDNLTNDYTFQFARTINYMAYFRNVNDVTSAAVSGPYQFSFVVTPTTIQFTRYSQSDVRTENFVFDGDDIISPTIDINNITSYARIWFHRFSSSLNIAYYQFAINPSWNGFSDIADIFYVFFDKDGNQQLIVSILAKIDSTSNFIFTDPRRYYLLDSSLLSDNAFYQQGKSDGLVDGRAEGDAAGYQRGYDAGYSVGERSGFNDGVASANDYSFLGLFGAIVDAPLSAFTGLFDFNLSFDGVHNFNLKGFFLAMLTIAIVIAIIRFALKR